MLFLKLVHLLFCIHFALADGYIIELLNGKIRGKEVTTRAGVKFYSYTDIPFAKPPVGKLRFQAPQPAENWEGILDATKSDKKCYNVGTDGKNQTEDCLVLNVYTPLEPGTNKYLPVMYHIHGGGFVGGAGIFDANGPHYFMEHEVVIVTVNYRIGPFGFLSTGDTIIPGNYGLKDQNLGLKWVQQNIHLFGGDPTKVTVFGLSAGSASATLQLISKQSKGLFRGVIAESGSALNPWAYQRHHVKIAYQLATNIDPNFNTSSTSEELLEFLQTIPADQLNSVSGNIRIGYRDQMAKGFYYGPCVEPEHNGAFLTENMYESIRKGNVNKVPMMIGMTSEEELHRVDTLGGYAKFVDFLKRYDENLALLVPDDLHITNEGDKKIVGEEIKKIYTDNLLSIDVGAAIRQFSDTCFSRPIIKHAELHSSYADLYFYQFSYHGTIIPRNNVYIEGVDRVLHSEDSVYLWAFGGNDNILDYAENDVLTLKRYVTLHTNFAKTLNPTPIEDELLCNLKWPKVQPGNFQYLNINDTLSIEKNPKSNTYSKWVSLYEKWGKQPFDTY